MARSRPEPTGSLVAGLLLELPSIDAAGVAAARDAARERPVVYPLGSGQAEEVALAAGLRPLIRQLLDARTLRQAQARFERAGLSTGVAQRVYGPTRNGWDHTPEALGAGDPGSRQALFVGRDRGRIDQAIACDLAKTDDADRELGRLLGYPRCCVEAFVATSRHRLNTDLYAATAERTRGASRPRLNALDLGVFHFISWNPCSFDCAWSLIYADAVAERLRRRYADFVARIDEALAAHRLVLLDEVQLSIRGPFDGTSISIDEVWPTARDRHPSAALDPDALEAVARVLALARRAKRLQVTMEGLLLDGERVRGTRGAFLVPFGGRV
jgi:hypothetical protein